MRYDTIVIGAGHNGLIAALRLARAGSSVLVLERLEEVGGLCGPLEILPGYVCPGVLSDTTSFHPLVASALQLHKNGLKFETKVPGVLGLGSNGTSILLSHDPQENQKEIAAHAKKDAASFSGWKSFLDDVRPAVQSLMEAPPPALQPAGSRDLVRMGRQGLSVRRLGKKRMLDLLRVVPMSVSDWLEESFESPLLQQTLALPGVFGSFAGPRAAGTAANLLLKLCTSGRAVKGGPSALIRALERACNENSVTVKTSAAVRRILVQNGRVQGVELEDGDFIEAHQVASSCHPVQTLLGMVEPAQLTLRLEQEMRNYRSRGVLALVCLALNAPLTFQGRTGAQLEFARVGGEGLDSLEKTFDAVKYGQWAAQPFLEVWMPSVPGPSPGPQIGHVASILVYCAPWHLKGAWNEMRREQLYETVLQNLTRHVSDLHDRIIGHKVLTPMDLERSHALRGGHLCHGEHALDQLLFMRPSASVAGYRTPIRGLYLAGSGSHPGGGITGLPGFLAAETILRDS